MQDSNEENKKPAKKGWHVRAWVFTVTVITGLGVVVGLINGWFTIVKNIKGDKPSKDSVRIIAVPIMTTDSADAKDSCVIARKKLNETGVNWSIQSFVDALVDDDQKNI